jgi:2-oxo-4-hydroxy-4-carboxy-5-ureidoimidazoline decarboxylase
VDIIDASSHTLASFNTRPADEVERDLLACCAVPGWARAVVAGRPYPDLGALVATADAALAALTWDEVALALAAHPRIGERPTGTDRESAWSRREQAAVTDADAQVRAALAEANREYEQRFGHLFLIFASGRSRDELLAAARQRLGNDTTTEQHVVHGELRKIARLRLERLLGTEPAVPARPATPAGSAPTTEASGPAS